MQLDYKKHCYFAASTQHIDTEQLLELIKQPEAEAIDISGKEGQPGCRVSADLTIATPILRAARCGGEMLGYFHDKESLSALTAWATNCHPGKPLHIAGPESWTKRIMPLLTDAGIEIASVTRTVSGRPVGVLYDTDRAAAESGAAAAIAIARASSYAAISSPNPN